MTYPERHRRGGNGPVPCKRARILSDEEDLSTLLDAAGRTRYAVRNRLLVALNFLAGLRMPEIARLDRRDIQHENGDVRDFLILRDAVSKRTPGRRISMKDNTDLSRLARDYLRRTTGAPTDPLIVSERGGRMRGDAIAYVFYKLYRQAGLHGYTPFSGRRTHIANALEQAGVAGEPLQETYQRAGLCDLGAMEPYKNLPTSPSSGRRRNGREDVRQMSFL